MPAIKSRPRPGARSQAPFLLTTGTYVSPRARPTRRRAAAGGGGGRRRPRRGVFAVLMDWARSVLGVAEDAVFAVLDIVAPAAAKRRPQTPRNGRGGKRTRVGWFDRFRVRRRSITGAGTGHDAGRPSPTASVRKKRRATRSSLVMPSPAGSVPSPLPAPVSPPASAPAVAADKMDKLLSELAVLRQQISAIQTTAPPPPPLDFDSDDDDSAAPPSESPVPSPVQMPPPADLPGGRAAAPPPPPPPPPPGMSATASGLRSMQSSILSIRKVDKARSRPSLVTERSPAPGVRRPATIQEAIASGGVQLLRAVDGVQRSPGGTPVNKTQDRSHSVVTHQDFVMHALRNKFASTRAWNSSDSEDDDDDRGFADDDDDQYSCGTGSLSLQLDNAFDSEDESDDEPDHHDEVDDNNDNDDATIEDDASVAHFAVHLSDEEAAFLEAGASTPLSNVGSRFLRRTSCLSTASGLSDALDAAQSIDALPPPPIAMVTRRSSIATSTAPVATPPAVRDDVRRKGRRSMPTPPPTRRRSSVLSIGEITRASPTKAPAAGAEAAVPRRRGSAQIMPVLAGSRGGARSLCVDTQGKSPPPQLFLDELKQGLVPSPSTQSPAVQRVHHPALTPLSPKSPVAEDEDAENRNPNPTPRRASVLSNQLPASPKAVEAGVKQAQQQQQQVYKAQAQAQQRGMTHVAKMQQAHVAFVQPMGGSNRKKRQGRQRRQQHV